MSISEKDKKEVITLGGELEKATTANREFISGALYMLERIEEREREAKSA